MPDDPLERARVLAVALMIACDIHPLNNTSVLAYLREDLGAGRGGGERLVRPLGAHRDSRRSSN